jgi:predicted XRE-type DNA-binding protein
MRKTTRKPAVDAEDEKVVTTVGSNDNIFEALELPHADEWLAKAELTREIERLIRGRGLTQTQAARVLAVVQSDISNLYRGRLAGYSMERLYRFLTTLGQDVQIVVRPTPRSRARGRVRAVVGAVGNARNRRTGRGR